MASTAPAPHIIPVQPMQSTSSHIHTPAQQKDEEFRRNHAYKYFGYPEFCRFVATENDFFLLRRFGALNARVLLNLQHDIIQLENELNVEDGKCRDEPDSNYGRLDNLSWDKKAGNPWPRRSEIVYELQPLLQRYSAFKQLPTHHLLIA